jgi:hypothetical protein
VTSLRGELDLARSHAIRTFDHNGTSWKYRAIGSGPQGLLLLPGGRRR